MADKYFLGDAVGVAQETHVTVGSPEVGDVFKLTCNRKTISITAALNSDGSVPTAADITLRFVAAIGQLNNDIPEWAEISASAGTDDAGAVTYLKLTGLDDGTPFTVTSSTSNVSVFNITVASLQTGTTSTNQKQRIVLPGPPTGGNFTLTMRGATTGNIAYNASSATVKTAIEALATVGAGNTTVTLNGTGDWTVEFTSSLALKRMPNFSGTNVSLTAACSIQVEVAVEGRAASYAKGPIYQLEIAQSPVDSFRFKYTGGSGFAGNPYYSTPVSNSGSGATADQIRIALESILVPPVLIASTDLIDNPPPTATMQAYSLLDVTGPAGGPWVIVVRDGQGPALNATDSLAIDNGTIMSSPGVAAAGSVALTVVSASSITGISEKQYVAIIGGPTGGTYALTFEGSTTAGIAYNAVAATVQAAFVALASVGAGNCAVSGSGTTADPFLFLFQSGLASTNVSRITADASSLTGATPKIEVAQDAVQGRNSIQEVSITGGKPTGGTFTLNPFGTPTAAIAYNASASTVATALAVLSSATDYGVTGGPLPSTAIIVEFKGTFAGGGPVNNMVGVSSLTASNTQTLVVAANTTNPTGPFHWDNANNWSGGTQPIAGDRVYVANISTDIRHGLDGISSTWVETHFMASFTGKFGLKPVNAAGYYEYRQLCGNVNSTSVFVGEGSGSASPFIYINAGSVAQELICYATGTPEDTSIPALLWKGTNASNIVRIFKGSFGAAIFTGDTASILTFQVGYRTDRTSDVEYVIGSGVSITTAEQSGGNGLIDLRAANISSFTASGGTAIINGTAGISTSFKASGESVVQWNTTGTMQPSPQLYDKAKLDLSQDMRAKNFASPIDIFGTEAVVNDPFKVASQMIVSADPFYIFFGLAINYHTDVLCNDSQFGSSPIVLRVAS